MQLLETMKNRKKAIAVTLGICSIVVGLATLAVVRACDLVNENFDY